MSSHRFRYAPLTAGSHQVGIAGDFTAWKIVPMTDFGGTYLYAVELPAGKYRYKFIVDGNWITDPDNPDREPDPFGSHNSVLKITDIQALLTWESIIEKLAYQSINEFYGFTRSGEDAGELRFYWQLGFVDRVVAHIDNIPISMSRIGRTPLKEVFHLLFNAISFPFSVKTSLSSVPIYFEIQYQDETIWLDNEGLNRNLEDISPIQFDISEHPIFDIPPWVGEKLIYQIFPDRFCNGDPARNPDFSQWYYQDCKTLPPLDKHLLPEREYFHFVEDWKDISGLQQSPYLPEGKPDWWSFYGGDIAGVQSKLDYIAKLHINTIYFNPLWQAKSNHKYDATDYHSIDPQFASTAGMMEFVQHAHARGIRIILDVAFNHTGETFWAFRDCVEKGCASPYWNWYDWKKWPLPKPLPPDFKPRDYYQCWWGIKDMPDLNYDLSRHHPEENAITDINEALPNWALVNYLLETVRWWLQDIGIDGFRLDVPDEVPFWFWELFRKHVKSIKPDAWIVGEIWHHAEDWVNHKYFDSVMNYACFKNPVLDYLMFGLIGKDEFIQHIETGLAIYPWHALKAMMNMLGSHDTLRIFTLAKGDIARLKLVILFQFTFIGAPHIYYGDEIAMPGGKDPDNRRPFNWDWERNPNAVELHEFYIEIASVRTKYPALVDGTFCFQETKNDLLIFTREDKQHRISVVINPTRSAVEYPHTQRITVLLSTNDMTDSMIPACSGIVLTD